MARLMPALEFRSFHSHRSCENLPNTTRLATLTSNGQRGATGTAPPPLPRPGTDASMVHAPPQRSPMHLTNTRPISKQL